MQASFGCPLTVGVRYREVFSCTTTATTRRRAIVPAVPATWEGRVYPEPIPISSADVRRVCGPAESSVRCKLGIRLWLNLSSSPAGCGPRARPGREAGPRLSPPPAWAQPAGACRAVLRCWAFSAPAPLFFCSGIMSAYYITLMLRCLLLHRQSKTGSEGKGREGGPREREAGICSPVNLDLATNATFLHQLFLCTE